MSGGYIENYGKVYGCYTCGEIMGEYILSVDGYYMCSVCGEPHIVSLETCLDIMINLQKDGHTFTSSYYDEDLATNDYDEEE